jgi:hypothetical protein
MPLVYAYALIVLVDLGVGSTPKSGKSPTDTSRVASRETSTEHHGFLLTVPNGCNPANLATRPPPRPAHCTHSAYAFAEEGVRSVWQRSGPLDHSERWSPATSLERPGDYYSGRRPRQTLEQAVRSDWNRSQLPGRSIAGKCQARSSAATTGRSHNRHCPWSRF